MYAFNNCFRSRAVVSHTLRVESNTGVSPGGMGGSRVPGVRRLCKWGVLWMLIQEAAGVGGW